MGSGLGLRGWFFPDYANLYRIVLQKKIRPLGVAQADLDAFVRDLVADTDRTGDRRFDKTKWRVFGMLARLPGYSRSEWLGGLPRVGIDFYNMESTVVTEFLLRSDYATSPSGRAPRYLGWRDLTVCGNPFVPGRS